MTIKMYMNQRKSIPKLENKTLVYCDITSLIIHLLIIGMSKQLYNYLRTEGKSNFSEQFRKLINRYKRIGYSLDIMRQTACLVVNPIIVDGYASLFNCTTAVRASDSMTASS